MRSGESVEFDEWFSKSIGHNLSGAINFADSASRQLETRSSQRVSEVKQLQQQLAIRAKPLFNNPNYICTFIRRRMNQWDCYMTPHVIYQRAASRHVRPAVAFAYLHFVLNGLTTYQVMHSLPGYQGVDKCKFGCQKACDSLKHYWSCPIIREAFFKCLPGRSWINSPSFFFLIDGDANPKLLSQRLRFLHATYMAFNKLSHIPAGSCDPVELIVEFFQISMWSS